jgi:hypothetical protein
LVWKLLPKDAKPPEALSFYHILSIKIKFPRFYFGRKSAEFFTGFPHFSPANLFILSSRAKICPRKTHPALPGEKQEEQDARFKPSTTPDGR